LRREHEAERQAARDAELGITPRQLDLTTVRELTVEWRESLHSNQELHAATIRTWEGVLAAMFGEPARSRRGRQPGGPVRQRKAGARRAFELIADKRPDDVTAYELKKVLAAVSASNGSSTA